MFDGLEDVPSLEEASNEIFGITPFPNTPQIKVKLVDIDTISPDPTQPRRAIPSEIRSKWKPLEDPFEDLIALWFEYMEPGFDLEAYLLDGDTKRSQADVDRVIDFEPDAIQSGFLRLLDLASSIFREGLTNPITISRVGREYMIETGERRWLAYQLLNTYFEDSTDKDWSKIPARIMPERNVWRQATENNVRQNLNAISRARQLAILLMDIFGWDNFQSIDAFDSEQDFYAQVSDGYEWRIPKDKTELLLKAMGLNNQTQLRQYRALLRIDPLLWQTADDNDLTENAIREIVQKRNAKKEKSSKTNLKNQKIDQLIRQVNQQQDTFSKYAKQTKDADRSKLKAFAQQQVDWWNNLVKKLDH